MRPNESSNEKRGADWLDYVRAALIVIASVCVIIGAVALARTNAEEDEYRKTVQAYTIRKPKPTIEVEAPEMPAAPEDTPSPSCVIGADYEALHAVSEDVAGWITIPDTGIDYPVMQCESNWFYLSHAWDGSRSNSGAAFFDCGETLADARNYIVYGHSMSASSKVMFSPLLQYKNSEFLTEHPYIYVSFADDPIGRQQISESEGALVAGEYEFRIFAVMEVSTDSYENINAHYWFGNDKTSDELSEYVERCREESLYEMPEIGTPARILTLSTCSYPNTGSNVKLVICAAVCESSLAEGE